MRRCEAKVGMEVQIIMGPKEYDDGPWFADGMDKYKGKKTTIIGIYDSARVKLKIDKGEWRWDPRWLTKVDKTIVKKTTKKSPKKVK